MPWRVPCHQNTPWGVVEPWNTSGAADKHESADGLLFDVRILENLFDGPHRLPEEVHIEFFKPGAGKGLRQVRPQSFQPLRKYFAGWKESAWLFRPRAWVYPAHEGSSRHRCRSSSCIVWSNSRNLRLQDVSPAVARTSKNTVVDREKGNVEGTTTEIVDDNLCLPAFLIQSVSDGGGRWLIGNTKNLRTSDCSHILGSFHWTIQYLLVLLFPSSECRKS